MKAAHQSSLARLHSWRGSALRVAPQVERTRRRSSRGCGLAGRAASLTSVASVLLQHRYPNLATGLQRPLGHPHALPNGRDRIPLAPGSLGSRGELLHL